MALADSPLRRHLAVGLALAGTGLCLPAAAQARWVSGTYVYADLCTMPEDGTQVGRRITLKRWPTGDNLVYEGSGLSAPIEAAVSVDDATKTVAFQVVTSAGALRFEGTAGADALIGTLHAGTEARPIRLKRVLRARAQEACPGETTGSIN